MSTEESVDWSGPGDSDKVRRSKVEAGQRLVSTIVPPLEPDGSQTVGHGRVIYSEAYQRAQETALEAHSDFIHEVGRHSRRGRSGEPLEVGTRA